MTSHRVIEDVHTGIGHEAQDHAQVSRHRLAAIYLDYGTHSNNFSTHVSFLLLQFFKPARKTVAAEIWRTEAHVLGSSGAG
jgi:hypothetical protein